MHNSYSGNISSGLSINSFGVASSPILDLVEHPDRDEIRSRTFELTNELNEAMIGRLEEAIKSSRENQDVKSVGSRSTWGSTSDQISKHASSTVMLLPTSEHRQKLKRVASEHVLEELMIPDPATPGAQLSVVTDTSSLPEAKESRKNLSQRNSGGMIQKQDSNFSEGHHASQKSLERNASQRSVQSAVSSTTHSQIDHKFVSSDYTTELLREFQHPNQRFMKHQTSESLINPIFNAKIESEGRPSVSNPRPEPATLKKKSKSRKSRQKSSEVYLPKEDVHTNSHDDDYNGDEDHHHIDTQQRTQEPTVVQVQQKRQKESLLTKLGLTQEELSVQRITTNRTFSPQHGYTRNLGYLDLTSTANVLSEKPFLLIDAETPQDYVSTGVTEQDRLKQRTRYFRSTEELLGGDSGGFVNLLVEYGQYLGIDQNKPMEEIDYSEERTMLGMCILSTLQKAEQDGVEQVQRYRAQCEEVAREFEERVKSHALKYSHHSEHDDEVEETSTEDMFSAEKLESLLQAVPKPSEPASLQSQLRTAAERAVLRLQEERAEAAPDLDGQDSKEELEQVEEARERMKRMLMRVNTLWSNTRMAMQFAAKMKKGAAVDSSSVLSESLHRSLESRLLRKDGHDQGHVDEKLFDFEKLHAFSLRKYLDELHQRVLPSKKSVLRAAQGGNDNENQALKSLGDSFLKEVQIGGHDVFSDGIELQGDKVLIRKAGDDSAPLNKKAMSVALPVVYTSQGNSAMELPAVKALRIYYSSHRSVVWRQDQLLRLCLGVAIYTQVVNETTENTEQQCLAKVKDYFLYNECTCDWTPEFDERDMLLRKILDSIPLCVCGNLRIKYTAYSAMHNILAQAITYTSQALSHTLQASPERGNNHIVQLLAESLTESYLDNIKPKNTMSTGGAQKQVRINNQEESFRTSMKAKTTQMQIVSLPELSQTLPKPQQIDTVVMDDWRKDMYSDAIPCREMIAREVQHRKTVRKALIQDYKKKKLTRAFTTRTGGTFDRQNSEEDAIITKIRNMDIPAPSFSAAEMQEFSLSLHGLRASLFEVTDLWTVGITIEEYLEFLDTMQSRVQQLLSLHTESLTSALPQDNGETQWNELWTKKKSLGDYNEDSGLSDVSDTDEDEEWTTTDDSEYDDDSEDVNTEEETDRKLRDRIVKMPEYAVVSGGASGNTRGKEPGKNRRSDGGRIMNTLSDRSTKKPPSNSSRKKHQELSSFTYEDNMVFVTLIDGDGNVRGKVNVHDNKFQFSIDPQTHRIIIHDHMGRFLGYCFNHAYGVDEGMDGHGGESGSEEDLWNVKSVATQIYKRIEALRKEGNNGTTTRLIVAYQTRAEDSRGGTEQKDRVKYTADGKIQIETDGFSELEETRSSMNKSRRHGNRSTGVVSVMSSTAEEQGKLQQQHKLSKREKMQQKRLRRKELKRREAFIEQLRGWRQDSGLYSLFSRQCADDTDIHELIERLRAAVAESEGVEQESQAPLPLIAGESTTTSSILKLPLSVVLSLDQDVRDKILQQAKEGWKQANGLDKTDDASILRLKFNTEKLEEPDFVMSAEEEQRRAKLHRSSESRKARLYILQEGLVASQPKVVNEQVDAMTGKVMDGTVKTTRLARSNSFGSLGSVITARSTAEPSIVNPDIPISCLRNKHQFLQLEFFTRAAMALSSDHLWNDPGALASFEAFQCKTDVDRTKDLWKQVDTRSVQSVPHQNIPKKNTLTPSPHKALVIDPFRVNIKGNSETKDLTEEFQHIATQSLTIDSIDTIDNQFSAPAAVETLVDEPYILPEEQINYENIHLHMSAEILEEAMRDQGMSDSSIIRAATQTVVQNVDKIDDDGWNDLTDNMVLELALNPNKFAEQLEQKAQREAELALQKRKREEYLEKQRWLEQMKLQRGRFDRNLGTYGSYREPLDMSHISPQLYHTALSQPVQKLRSSSGFRDYINQDGNMPDDDDEQDVLDHATTPNILKLRINPHMTPTLLLSLAQAVTSLFSKLPHAISVLRAYAPAPVAACLPVLGDSVLRLGVMSRQSSMVDLAADLSLQVRADELRLEHILQQSRDIVPERLVKQFEREERALLTLSIDGESGPKKYPSLGMRRSDSVHRPSSEADGSAATAKAKHKTHGPFGLSVQSLATLLTSSFVSWERYFASTLLTHVNETITRAQLGYDPLMTRVLGKRRGSLMERRASMIERRDSIFDEEADSSFSAAFLQRNADLLSLTQSMAGNRRRGMFLPGNAAAAAPVVNERNDENWTGVVFKGHTPPQDCQVICGVTVSVAPKQEERPLLLSVLQDKLKGMKLRFLPMEVSRLKHFCKKQVIKEKEVTRGHVAGGTSFMVSIPSTPVGNDHNNGFNSAKRLTSTHSLENFRKLSGTPIHSTNSSTAMSGSSMSHFLQVPVTFGMGALAEVHDEPASSTSLSLAPSSHHLSTSSSKSQLPEKAEYKLLLPSSWTVYNKMCKKLAYVLHELNLACIHQSRKDNSQKHTFTNNFVALSLSSTLKHAHKAVKLCADLLVLLRDQVNSIVTRYVTNLNKQRFQSSQIALTPFLQSIAQMMLKKSQDVDNLKNKPEPTPRTPSTTETTPTSADKRLSMFGRSVPQQQINQEKKNFSAVLLGSAESTSQLITLLETTQREELARYLDSWTKSLAKAEETVTGIHATVLKAHPLFTFAPMLFFGTLLDTIGRAYVDHADQKDQIVKTIPESHIDFNSFADMDSSVQQNEMAEPLVKANDDVLRPDVIQRTHNYGKKESLYIPSSLTVPMENHAQNIHVDRIHPRTLQLIAEKRGLLPPAKLPELVQMGLVDQTVPEVSEALRFFTGEANDILRGMDVSRVEFVTRKLKLGGKIAGSDCSTQSQEISGSQVLRRHKTYTKQYLESRQLTKRSTQRLYSNNTLSASSSLSSSSSLLASRASIQNKNIGKFNVDWEPPQYNDVNEDEAPRPVNRVHTVVPQLQPNRHRKQALQLDLAGPLVSKDGKGVIGYRAASIVRHHTAASIMTASGVSFAKDQVVPSSSSVITEEQHGDWSASLRPTKGISRSEKAGLIINDALQGQWDLNDDPQQLSKLSQNTTRCQVVFASNAHALKNSLQATQKQAPLHSTSTPRNFSRSYTAVKPLERKNSGFFGQETVKTSVSLFDFLDGHTPQTQSTEESEVLPLTTRTVSQHSQPPLLGAQTAAFQQVFSLDEKSRVRRGRALDQWDRLENDQKHLHRLVINHQADDLLL